MCSLLSRSFKTCGKINYIGLVNCPHPRNTGSSPGSLQQFLSCCKMFTSLEWKRVGCHYVTLQFHTDKGYLCLYFFYLVSNCQFHWNSLRELFLYFFSFHCFWFDLTWLITTFCALGILLSLCWLASAFSQKSAKTFLLIHSGCKVSSGRYDLLTNSCSISQLAGSASRPGQIHWHLNLRWHWGLGKKHLRIDLETCTMQKKYEVE